MKPDPKDRLRSDIDVIANALNKIKIKPGENYFSISELINSLHTYSANVEILKYSAPVASEELYKLFKDGFDQEYLDDFRHRDSFIYAFAIKNIQSELEICKKQTEFKTFKNFTDTYKIPDGASDFAKLAFESEINFLKKVIAENLISGQQTNFERLAIKVKKYESEVSTTQNKIADVDSEIQLLEKRLNDLSGQAGFVELNRGFSALRISKIKELKTKSTARLILMGTIIAVLLGETIWMMISSSKDWQHHIFTSIPAISMTLILIYFFRLAYREEDAVRSQILQLDLRMALLKFLKSYSKFTDDLRPSDKKGAELDKFESIIFSHLAPNQEKMPGAFDNVDEVIKLLKASK